MLHILGMLVIGFFVGLLARALHPGDDRMGIIMTSLLGIGGSAVGGFGAEALHLGPLTMIGRFIAAILGAIVLLAIGHTIRRMAR